MEAGGPLTASRVTLGPFELREPLARGGMGVVWRGQHVQQQVPVAIKVLDRLSGGSADLVRALEHEVRAVAGLDHPHVIWVYDQGVVDAAAVRATGGQMCLGSPWLAMELADRGSLVDEPRGERRWVQVRRVLLDLLDALGHAHARGVLHRDIKPANLLFQGDERGRRVLKLSDFGMGFSFEQDRPEAVSGGTPLFMAPEQFTGDLALQGPWTDLYAVGCLAWLLVTRTTPFPRGSWRELGLAHARKALPTFVPRMAVPEGLEAWLRGMLAKTPSARFRRAADAAWTLADLPEVTTGDEAVALDAAADAPTVLRRAVSLDAPTTTHPRFSVVLPSPGGPPVERASGGPPLPDDWRRPRRTRRSASLVGAGLGLYGLRPIPMVDREPERDAAWAALLRVHEHGAPQGLVLRGPSGCGKSRLAEWLCRRAHEVGGATVLRATHNPVGGPQDGLAGLVARLLRTPTDLDPAQLSEHLDAAATHLGPWTADERARVVELLSPRVGAGGMTASERHVQLLHLLARLARERPLVVWLDDVHWGPEALTFAQLLLERAVVEVPALVMLTVQDEAMGDRPGAAAALDGLQEACGDALQTLEVGPLQPAHRIELVQQLLGVSGEVAARVEARTVGNPLFAVQLVGDWVQRGLLVPGAAGFELVAGAEVHLPHTVEEVWGARVERLLEGRGDAWAVPLELAAALGHEVDQEEWRAVCVQVGTPVPDELVRQLLDQRLLREDPERGRVSLVHGMLRETLTSRAATAGRLAAHHGACVHMLQQRPKRRGHAERLGRHLLLAGAAEAALEPLGRGLQERIPGGEIVQAMEIVALRERALQALGDPEDPRWVDVWIERAQVLRLLGRLGEARDVAREAVDAARERGGPLARAGALRQLSQLLLHTTASAEVEGLLEEALEQATSAGLASEAASVRLEQGRVAQYRGDLDRAGQLYARVLVDCVALGSRRGEADAEAGLAWVAVQQERLDEADVRARRARALYVELGLRWRLAWCDTLIGEVARHSGDLDAAERAYREVIDTYLQLGTRQTAVARVNLALVLCRRDRYPKAREVMEQARVEALNAGHDNLAAMIDVFALEVLAGCGDWEAFNPALERAEAVLSEALMVDPDLAASAELAGDLAERSGHTDQARRARVIAADQWQRLGKLERAASLLGDTPLRE